MNYLITSQPLTGCWGTHIGGRSMNQDNCGFIDTKRGFLVVVCDGMGGGPAGEIASAIAVKKIVEYVVNAPEDETNTKVLEDAIVFANNSIINETQKRLELRGMGTTVTAVLLNKEKAVLAHVGDSRIYQFRRGITIFRTEDHSYVGDLVRQKALTEEQARLSSQSNIITRALGRKADKLADISERPYEKGDRFMLCTDGIWGTMPEKKLVKRVANKNSMSSIVDDLIFDINEKGREEGNMHDNMTIALFETNKDSTIKEKMSKKTLRILMALASVCIISLFINLIMLLILLKPSDSQKKLLLQKIELEQKADEIGLLKHRIDSLNEMLAKVNLDMASADRKAAQAEREAAQKSREEAEAAARKAQESARQVEQVSNEIRGLIGSVKSNLKNIRDMKETADRKKKRNNVIAQLKTLESKDPKHKNTYNEVITWLNNRIATENSNMAKGHYNRMIQELEKIK